MFSKSMRVILTAIIAISLVVVLTAEDNGRGTAITAQASEKKPECVRVAEYKRILKKKVIRFSHTGGNYIHYKIKNRGERRLLRMKNCARKAGLKRRLHDMKKVTYHRRLTWRAHRYVNLITVYGQWAIPSSIVGRESGGDICAMNPESTAGGYYQFIDSTWYSMMARLTKRMKTILRRLGWNGGITYASHHPAACLHPALQHMAGYIAWNGGNNSHWTQTRY